MVVDSLETLLQHGKRFGCLYIDPPWRYRNTRTRGAAVKHYPTMSQAELIALPVAQLAAPDSHLHLWTTTSFIFDAIALVEAWSFRYESLLIWHKPQMGLGNYWRISTEMLLLGVRGDCPFPPGVEISSCQHHSRLKHSEKPELFRQLIMQVSPGPYLELFARRDVPGWTVWGNEVAPLLAAD